MSKSGEIYVSAVSGPSVDSVPDDNDALAARWGERMAAMFVETMTAETTTSWDFSADTLAALDDLIDEWWPEGPGEDTIEHTGRVMAGYVGEVIRRQLDGHWIGDDRLGPGVMVGTKVAFPISKVAKRFREGRSDSLAVFFFELRAVVQEGDQARSSVWREWTEDEKRARLTRNSPPPDSEM